MSKFTDDFTFTRGTGATRINAAGLIVGVDFSSTSNTIGTGAKTFTLAADANVNRDWPVGSAVRVVDQVSANTMEGTVTTYTPSTQALVLDITSVTGSGTFTNWRIGSLEVRRDADGVLREPMRSNNFTRSSEFNDTTWSKLGLTVTANNRIGASGSLQADRLVTDGTASAQRILKAVTLSGQTCCTFLMEAGSAQFVQILNTSDANAFANFDLVNGLIGTKGANTTAEIKRVSGQIWACSMGAPISGASTNWGIYIIPSLNSAYAPNFTATVADVFLSESQLESGLSPTSIIPTTTVAVTRNADTFTFTPAAIAKFRQGQGALIVEANASDAGTAQRAALRLTGPAGEIRLGKQGVATSGNFTKMAEGGDVQLLGNATQGVTNNGLEYGLFNPIDERTGLAQGAAVLSNVAYDGSSGFGTTNATAESTVNSTLSNISGKGIGGNTLNGAHHNGSRFLIPSDVAGLVFISTDGIGYRRVNTPVIAQPCNEVTSGLVGATLRNVIIGNTGFIATSDDNGETWTSRTSGTALAINAATRSTTNFIIAIQSTSSAANLRTSSDGITYNAVANSGVSNSLIDVHANGAQVVAVGAGGVITVSNDNGATWAASTSSGVTTTQQLNGVHYNASANLWVAVGNAGTIITATDPTGTWTLQTSGTAQNLVEVNYFNSLWVAVGAANTVITSPNATAWTARTANISATINGIAASATRLIITGTAGGFASSEDGLTYTSRTNNNATLNGIAYGAGMYVSVGNAVNGSGYIATIDGAGTVTRRVSGITTGLSGVRYLNGAFYAFTNSAATTQNILRSLDGITWTLLAGTALTIVAVDGAFGGGVYVAIGEGSSGRFSLSTDGLVFTSSTFGVTTSPMRSIDFANGVFVAVGNTGTIITGIYNGSTVVWTLRTSGTTQNLTSVMFSTRDQRWYAAGNAGTLLYSEDNGVTWASVNNAGFGAVSNTTLQANKLLQQWKSGRNTMALSYKANEVIVGLNGVAVTDTANTIPSITGGVLGESFNGKIKSAKFQPNPLTLAEIEAITGVTA